MKISIKERRKAAGLLQEEIAAKLGISGSQYSRLERNPSRARFEQLEMIAKLLGCSVSDIQGAGDEVAPLARVRRTIPVYSMSKSSWGRPEMNLVEVGEYSPTGAVSSEAYAVLVETEDLSNHGRNSVYPGDWMVIDPVILPKSGDIVLAVDHETDEPVLRLYFPLHPSNQRAPGFLLKSTLPSVDEIYVSSKRNAAKGVVLGVVTEVRRNLRTA